MLWGELPINRIGLKSGWKVAWSQHPGPKWQDKRNLGTTFIQACYLLSLCQPLNMICLHVWHKCSFMRGTIYMKILHNTRFGERYNGLDMIFHGWERSSVDFREDSAPNIGQIFWEIAKSMFNGSDNFPGGIEGHKIASRDKELQWLRNSRNLGPTYTWAHPCNDV